MHGTAATADREGEIRIKDLDFYYDNYHALKNINLDITRLETTAIIGQIGRAHV